MCGWCGWLKKFPATILKPLQWGTSIFLDDSYDLHLYNTYEAYEEGNQIIVCRIHGVEFSTFLALTCCVLCAPETKGGHANARTEPIFRYVFLDGFGKLPLLFIVLLQLQPTLKRS